MSMQIKGKFIKNEAIDGSKIKLKAGEALKAVDSNGQEVELVKLVDGEVMLKGEAAVKASDLAAEKARAEAAEAALSASVSALEAEVGDNLQGAIAGLQSDIAAEKARAEAIEGTLSASLSALQSQVGEDLQNTITSLQADISAEAARAQTVEASLLASVGALETQVGANLQSTITSLQAADAANLAEAKAHADSKIAELVSSAPEVLNTLKELSDALGGDENFAATISGQLGAVQSAVSSEASRALAAESALDAKIVAETAARSSALTGVETKLSGVVASSKVIFDDNVNVYADSYRPKADPSGREGWFFKNDGGFAVNKVNWYFFNSSMATVTKQQLNSLYMVATVDTPDNRPYLAYHTARKNDGLDAASWYRSRLVFIPATPIQKQGKYLLFVGQDPGVHPELPRVQLVAETVSTRGPRQDDEVIMLASVQSDSSHYVNGCQFVVHKTGLKSSPYTQENSMVIRNDMTIEKLKLNMEAIKWKSEKFEVTAEMISAGYIEINTKDIVRDSITAHVGRLAIFKDEDFTVGYGTDGKFRLTFKGEILPGQPQALEAGDTIRVSYLVK